MDDHAGFDKWEGVVNLDVKVAVYVPLATVRDKDTDPEEIGQGIAEATSVALRRFYMGVANEGTQIVTGKAHYRQAVEMEWQDPDRFDFTEPAPEDPPNIDALAAQIRASADRVMWLMDRYHEQHEG